MTDILGTLSSAVFFDFSHDGNAPGGKCRSRSRLKTWIDVLWRSLTFYWFLARGSRICDVPKRHVRDHHGAQPSLPLCSRIERRVTHLHNVNNNNVHEHDDRKYFVITSDIFRTALAERVTSRRVVSLRHIIRPIICQAIRNLRKLTNIDINPL